MTWRHSGHRKNVHPEIAYNFCPTVVKQTHGSSYCGNTSLIRPTVETLPWDPFHPCVVTHDPWSFLHDPRSGPHNSSWRWDDIQVPWQLHLTPEFGNQLMFERSVTLLSVLAGTKLTNSIHDGNLKSWVRKNLVRPCFQKPDVLRCWLSL